MTRLNILVPSEPPRTIEVSPDVAERLRTLSDRGEHGMHLSKLGGIDALGELAALDVPFETRAFPSRGTGHKRVWITTTATIVTNQQD